MALEPISTAASFKKAYLLQNNTPAPSFSPYKSFSLHRLFRKTEGLGPMTSWHPTLPASPVACCAKSLSATAGENKRIPITGPALSEMPKRPDN